MSDAPSFINLDLIGDEPERTLLQQLRDVTSTRGPNGRDSSGYRNERVTPVND